jgi:hypothetical protein
LDMTGMSKVWPPGWALLHEINEMKLTKGFHRDDRYLRIRQ